MTGIYDYPTDFTISPYLPWEFTVESLLHCTRPHNFLPEMQYRVQNIASPMDSDSSEI